VSDWLELLLLAIASTFWPTLIMIVVLALRMPHPVGILLSFLIGGLLTTVTVGLVFVFALQNSSFMSGSRPPANPTLNISIGLLSLATAVFLSRREGVGANTATTHAEHASEPKTSGLAERAVQRGPLVAFLAGVVLNIVPGTFPFVALKDIAQLDAGNGTKVAAVVIFYVIMFAFVEIPIVVYLFAPERATAGVVGFNTWLGRNGRRIGVYVLAGVGVYLTVRGVVQLLS
jgi:hypothetical protein